MTLVIDPVKDLGKMEKI